MDELTDQELTAEFREAGWSEWAITGMLQCSDRCPVPREAIDIFRASIRDMLRTNPHLTKGACN